MLPLLWRSHTCIDVVAVYTTCRAGQGACSATPVLFGHVPVCDLFWRTQFATSLHACGCVGALSGDSADLSERGPSCMG